MKTVLFYENQLNLRGTSVATYDYADFNETILGNKSIIVAPRYSELDSLDKFSSRFKVELVGNFNEINNIPHDVFYTLKYGHSDGKISSVARNCIHAVFPSYEPHGDVYAYVSKWLSDTHGEGSPYVPHMVNMPQETGISYRQVLDLEDEFVFGWYGGDNFEIPEARSAVINAARDRKNCVFLFMNQTPFCDEPNVRFIAGTSDVHKKSAFIDTCDAMIHARYRGETFGLAIAEFSSKNKPVITYGLSEERNHIDTLGGKGFYYSNGEDLYKILMSMDRKSIEGVDWNCYKDYSPEKVMGIFNTVFL